MYNTFKYSMINHNRSFNKYNIGIFLLKCYQNKTRGFNLTEIQSNYTT